MKEVLNKIYIPITEKDEPTINDWTSVAMSQYDNKPVIENVCYIRKDIVEELKKRADAMCSSAQYLTTNASQLRKAMEEYRQFIICEFNKI